MMYIFVYIYMYTYIYIILVYEPRLGQAPIFIYFHHNTMSLDFFRSSIPRRART